MFPHLCKDFNHILYSLTESLEDDRVGFSWVFGEKSSNFASETNGNFYGIVCRLFQEEDDDLERNDFMRKGW
jgi:hypothetical protein